ncbi:3'-5' exonuclease [Desulfovibrio falkowii]|uniref:3'-5' exonuclease n=1 Tax=Desulfovibrio sp. WGS1351 TaxID=3366814 RepID=UPI00372D4C4E
MPEISTMRWSYFRGRLQLCKSFYEIEGIDIEFGGVVAQAASKNQDYLRSWVEIALLYNDKLSDLTENFLKNGFLSLLTSLDYKDFSQNLLAWIDSLRSSPGTDGQIFTEFDEEREIWNQIVLSTDRKFSEETVSLHQFLQELDLTSKSPPIQPGAVPCMSIHASKGLEFNHVYLIGLVEDQLPSFAALKKGDESFQMQEERRSCFVAITRAQEKLTLTYSDNVFGWSKAPSRFLSEMGVE